MSKVGIFDSGLGGLTVWSAIQQLQPSIPCLYLADQAHLPYGPRSQHEIQQLACSITQCLMEQGAQLIVVACNTASAAALSTLRQNFPQLRFVGMEPAVKPAALSTLSGVVGLMATRGTLQGDLLRNTAQRFAREVKIVSSECPGLAEAIERGDDNAQLRAMLNEHLYEMNRAGVDTVVLGCTHYPLIAPLIRQALNNDVELIDPAPAVARQVLRLFQELQLSENGASGHHFATSGDSQLFQEFLQTRFHTPSSVETWTWNGAKLTPLIAN
ncbi:MAG: glutamate racemase [Oceanococcus sp.]